MLRTTGESAHRLAGEELQSQAATVPNSAQGGQRRLASVCAQLLLALSSSGAPAADDRHRHEPHRLSLHRADWRDRHDPVKWTIDNAPNSPKMECMEILPRTIEARLRQ